MSERVHRLNHWPWARTLHRHATTPEHYCRVRTGAPPNNWPWTSTAEHDHHSKVDVPGTYCHATATNRHYSGRPGAPTNTSSPLTPADTEPASTAPTDLPSDIFPHRSGTQGRLRLHDLDSNKIDPDSQSTNQQIN